jgi:tetratricopeptide (TPR) repeat protein
MLKQRPPMTNALIVSLILVFSLGPLVRAQEQTTAEQDLQKGRILHIQGKTAEAIEVLKQALTKKPDLAEAHYYLGMSYYRMNQFEPAEGSLREALKLKNDTYPDAHYGLGMIHYKKREFDTAMRDFRTAIDQRSGNYPEAYNVMGAISFSQKNYAEAVKSFRKSLEQRPDSPEANLNLGQAVEKELVEGQGSGIAWDDAVNAYRAAVKYRAEYAQAHKFLGLALIGSDNDTAAAELETFLQQSPPQSTERAQIEEVLDLLKKPDDPAMQVEELGKVAGVGKRPTPRPTPEAIKNKVQGSVVVVVLFCYDKRVRVVKVVKGLGNGLDETAVDSLRRTQYEPVMTSGRPTSGRRLVKIDFKM